MKKIYAFAVAALFATAAFGQRDVDMSLTLTTPTEGQHVAQSANQTVSFSIKHSGDSLVTGDTLFFYYLNMRTGINYGLTSLQAGSVTYLPIDANSAPIINSGQAIPSSAINGGNNFTLNTSDATAFQDGDTIMVVCEFAAVNTNPGDDSNLANNFGSFILDNAVASTNNINAINMSAYPNPATSELNIKASEEVKSVDVFSLDGKKVLSANGSKLNVSNLENGAYLYRVTTISGATATERFIKE